MEPETENQFSDTLEDKPVVVEIAALEYADSPRLAGESIDHIRTLASVGTELPPIVVHRQTMRVIDGMHRVRAAVMNNRRDIEVRFFDGSERDAFILAVRANTGHGLPLSLAEREAATCRIVKSHPEWSDRAIAEVTGLAPTTVARIRNRITEVTAQPAARVGKDGRVRPINGAAGRRAASQLIAARPDASLRQIAEMAGISPATAKDVRERMRRGDDPVPHSQSMAECRRGGTDVAERTDTETRERLRQQHRMDRMTTIIQRLRRDPALRMTDQGRQLLRWLNLHIVIDKEWDGLEPAIPPHCAMLVADLATICADEWTGIAKDLKRTRNH